MNEKLESLISSVYSHWKQGQHQRHTRHPDEEGLSCFLEGRLTEAEAAQIKAHLVICDTCMEAVIFTMKARAEDLQEAPGGFLLAARELLASLKAPSLLEIVLQFKEKFVSIVNTTGDILVGQELVPASVLRSRSIKDFQDEVVIMKDCNAIRVEVRIENKRSTYFNVHISVKNKETHHALMDLRASLFKDNLELESYLTDAGLVTFEHVPLGVYTLEISSLNEILAVVMIEIRL